MIIRVKNKFLIMERKTSNLIAAMKSYIDSNVSINPKWINKFEKPYKSNTPDDEQFKYKDWLNLTNYLIDNFCGDIMPPEDEQKIGRASCRERV